MVPNPSMVGISRGRKRSAEVFLGIVAAGLMGMCSPAVAEDWYPLWTTANLSQARSGVAGTSAGGKVFFAGGYAGTDYSNRVDIYDTATGLWSNASLSEARGSLSATSAGGKVFFGGGSSFAGFSSRVDIYDTGTGLWSTANLSQARDMPSATSAGGKAFFAGGGWVPPSGYQFSDRVDIYDMGTGSWSTATLSQARSFLSAASTGGKAFFGGGFCSVYSNRVDIYDTPTGVWSTATLSQGRYGLSATSAGGKVFFGGGGDSAAYSARVDIYDAGTGSWSTANLSEARYDLAATSAGNKVFFAGGYSGTYSARVDIYDTATGLWSTASLSQGRQWLAATSAGNKVFFAGGRYSYSGYSKVVDIYTVQDYGTITSTLNWTLVDNTTVAGRMQLGSIASLYLVAFNLTVGSMGGAAPIYLSGRTLTTGADGTSSTYSGRITGNGSFVKTGAGTLTLSGNVLIRGKAIVQAGTLELDGGSFFVGSYEQNAAGTLNLGIRGRTVGAWDEVDANGTLSLDGILHVELKGGFVPGFSDRFDLFDGTITGSFDSLEFPALPGDLYWNTTALYTTGEILVSPEPGTVAMIGLGGLALIRRRWASKSP